MAPNNPLPIHGNEKTMNMNHLILTNIQSSPYFKVNLYELKTYHEVIDEIYYRVEHLEPWEKGSRKTAGQTGMCGGVRGVGAGGIVSSAYCLLYKLFTLRLTRKQLNGLITHTDSPYIRALGFMYIRYTQPPADLWDWYSPYLDDEEELDVKAGGGHMIMIGAMVRQWLTKIEWYSTLFPRIPVPVQKALQPKLKAYDAERAKDEEYQAEEVPAEVDPEAVEGDINYGEAERISKLRSTDEPEGRSQRSGGESYDFAREIEREKDRQRREQEVGTHERDRKGRDQDRDIRDRDRDIRDRDRDMRDKDRNGRHRSRSRERDHHRRSRSRERHRHGGRSEEGREISRSHDQRDRRHSPARERKEGKDHRDRPEKKKSRDHKRSRSQERRRSKSKERKDRHKHKHKHRSRSKERTESRSHRELSPRDRERIRNGERP